MGTEEKTSEKSFIFIAYSTRMMYNHASSHGEESDMDLTGRNFLKLLDYTPEEIGDILYGSYDIICRTGLHCAPLILPYLGLGKQGSVRISMSRFTTREELEAFLQAIKEIVSE